MIVCRVCSTISTRETRMLSLANGSLLLSKISLPPPLLLLRDDVDYDSFPSSSSSPLFLPQPKFLGSFDHYLHLAPFLPSPSLFCSSVDREIFSPSGRPSLLSSLPFEEVHFFFLNGLTSSFSSLRPKRSRCRRSRYVKISGSRNLITEQRESLYLLVDNDGQSSTLQE